MSVNRNNNDRNYRGYPDERARYYREPQQEAEEKNDFQYTVKGLIAVFITILIVVIIVMLFAKSLFVSSSKLSANVKTGHITSTEYVSVATTAGDDVEITSVQKKNKKKTTTEDNTPDISLPADLDTSVAGKYVVNDSVYLHPEPSSSSENLSTLPAGAQVEVYGSSNYGWYYVKYDDQVGYAWGTYFTAAQ